MKLQATSSNDKLEATSSRGCCFDDPDGPDPKWTGEDEHDVGQDWNAQFVQDFFFDQDEEHE